jgi:PAS domain S-box-containing protein
MKNTNRDKIQEELREIMVRYNIGYDNIHDEIFNALKESELKYRTIVEHSIQGIVIVQDYCIVFANSSFEKIMGFTSDELLSLSPDEVRNLVHPDDRSIAWEQYDKRLAGKKVPKMYDFRVIRKDGSDCWVEAFSARIEFLGKPANLATFVDITKRKKAENSFKEQSVNLQDTNSALRILLKQRDTDKLDMEESLLLNIKETVFPYLDKLKKSRLEDYQKSYLDIIENNLKDMASPLIRNLSSRFLGLTPAEMQVANLTKQGKSVKEIAGLLNLAPGTIKTHRINIRKKIGITNQKINLRTFLLSLK